MNETAARVICDAGPLIHLDELGCIVLLDDFDEVLVSAQVWQEVIHHRVGVNQLIRSHLEASSCFLAAHGPALTMKYKFTWKVLTSLPAETAVIQPTSKGNKVKTGSLNQLPTGSWQRESQFMVVSISY